MPNISIGPQLVSTTAPTVDFLHGHTFWLATTGVCILFSAIAGYVVGSLKGRIIVGFSDAASTTTVDCNTIDAQIFPRSKQLEHHQVPAVRGAEMATTRDRSISLEATKQEGHKSISKSDLLRLLRRQRKEREERIKLGTQDEDDAISDEVHLGKASITK